VFSTKMLVCVNSWRWRSCVARDSRTRCQQFWNGRCWTEWDLSLEEVVRLERLQFWAEGSSHDRVRKGQKRENDRWSNDGNSVSVERIKNGNWCWEKQLCECQIENWRSRWFHEMSFIGRSNFILECSICMQIPTETFYERWTCEREHRNSSRVTVCWNHRPLSRPGNPSAFDGARVTIAVTLCCRCVRKRPSRSLVRGAKCPDDFWQPKWMRIKYLFQLLHTFHEFLSGIVETCSIRSECSQLTFPNFEWNDGEQW
jgi:hypothetical protein